MINSSCTNILVQSQKTVLNFRREEAYGGETLKTAVVAILLVLAICSSLVVFAACNEEGGGTGTEMTSEELFAFYRQEIVDMG